MVRRASATVFVVAILALLFIVGAALLFCSHAAHSEAVDMQKSLDRRAVLDSMTHSAMRDLRRDVVGR